MEEPKSRDAVSLRGFCYRPLNRPGRCVLRCSNGLPIEPVSACCMQDRLAWWLQHTQSPAGMELATMALAAAACACACGWGRRLVISKSSCHPPESCPRSLATRACNGWTPGLCVGKRACSQPSSRFSLPRFRRRSREKVGMAKTFCLIFVVAVAMEHVPVLDLSMVNKGLYHVQILVGVSGSLVMDGRAMGNWGLSASFSIANQKHGVHSRMTAPDAYAVCHGGVIACVPWLLVARRMLLDVALTAC